MVSYANAANEARFAADVEDLDLALYDVESGFAETKDVSGSKPEVLAGLRRSDERWFEDVKETCGFQPGRIHLGTEFENPSHLCRYQHGHRPYGTDVEAIGWPVRVPENGRYNLMADIKGFEGAVFVFRWKGETAKVPIASARRSIEVDLAEGDGMLDVWFEDLGGNRASRDFDVIVGRLR